ncbi:MAG: 16S rRNA (uracil(1498)-N(3))-methyltransferase [Bacteroidales bacterium]|nr:16S rRNA (uracil(1498)-N(3))-methyltransferase [Bacteroidales bacterium]MCM1147955.1 16S rRNA (uracil(1498)-N(3))-methyltransferase [Bacteroidales bacterium]MCM1206879.1 16S rRNA (uracil(1498)-N(3))-methyltransferase [Bacillota bacterium]MCM1509512.1 16S rRNA (uracil(1498)-N(3))-methyltransferase [Clostridium sp.]
MKEIRFFYAPEAADTEELPQEEATHAIRVLRLKPGDEIFLMDGKGTFYRAEITIVTNKKCLYRIVESMPQDLTWRGKIHLAIAPTKMMERIEWLAEKATEIGFDELSFLKCRFSERTKIRTDRIEKIVVSAVKQSHKAWVPAINEIQDFNSFVSQPREGRKFICHCYEEFSKEDFFNLITAVSDETSAHCDNGIVVLIGPEGDFSVEEVRMAIAHGYESVTLGKSRLRTETAGLQAVAMSNLARRI